MDKMAMNNRPMLNAYPDSMGGRLGDIVSLLGQDLKDAFSSFYILPSLYHTDLDRGFSVQDYGLEETLAKREDLDGIREMGIDLKLDFILNHASVLSPQFQDILNKGEQSEYKDFFINWNDFWAGCGEMTEEGYIKPDDKYIREMFFRKPGLPILMVQFPDGKEVPYWNTFYQKVWEENGKRHYLGQMDFNIKSPLVWKFYEDTLKTLADYGAKIVRLDAFAYAPKEPGEKNFMNEPGTWELLQKVQELSARYGLAVLPEIHASYEEGVYKKLQDKGYMTYDFFLPGLIIDAMEEKSGSALASWANELWNEKIQTVNMLGCHDGIPVLDLKGMIPDERIDKLIETIVGRGGYVKNLHGQKNMYYQVNATYYSALGEDDRKLLLARAIQMFIPGKPQVWYLDLFAGRNDHEAVRLAGEGGHKEINRTNLTMEQIQERLQWDVVKKQIELIRMRNSFPAFHEDAKLDIKDSGNILMMRWEYQGNVARLVADFSTGSFQVQCRSRDGEIVFEMNQI